MKFSRVSLLAAASTALAAPTVTVTEHVHQQHTAVVQGMVVVENGVASTSWTTIIDQGVSASTSSGSASATSSAYSTASTGSIAVSAVADYEVDASSSSGTSYSSASTSYSVSAVSQSIAAASVEATTTLAPSTTSTVASSTSTTSAPSSTSIPSSTSTSSSSSSSATSDFSSSILAEHNTKRALHKDTSDLTWSDTLATYAQNYADNYDCSGNLVHSGGSYGENLALGYSATGAVDAWYDEISSYDFSNPGYSSSTGHFTQVVWKSSTQVGCGIKACGNEWGNYVICSYSPAGNVIGEFDTNVMALK